MDTETTHTGVPGRLPDGNWGVWTDLDAKTGDKVFVESRNGKQWCSELAEQVQPGLFKLAQPMPTQETTSGEAGPTLEIKVPFEVVVLALLVAWCLAIYFASTLQVWLIGVGLAAMVDLTTRYSRKSKHSHRGKIETTEYEVSVHPSAWVVVVAVVAGIVFGGPPAVLVGAVFFFTKCMVGEDYRSWYLENHGEPK